MSPFLKMGLTSATFHLEGNNPHDMVLLNKSVKGLASSDDSSLNNLGCNPSGPGDLFILRPFNASFISSSVTNMVDIKFSFVHVKVGTLFFFAKQGGGELMLYLDIGQIRLKKAGLNRGGGGGGLFRSNQNHADFLCHKSQEKMNFWKRGKGVPGPKKIC